MKKNSGVIITLLTFLICAGLIGRPVLAQDAGLLNMGVQQFFNNNGDPLSSGKVYFYEVGTSTFKDTYTSSAATTVNPNPITLNAGGKSPSGGIYGIGTYRQVVKDKNNNLIWDAVTSPTGGGGGTPTDVGDGNLVGTILPWSSLVAPNQYVFAYGQEISRTTYPEFFTAVTLQANVICSSASNILTGLVDTTQIPIGADIELSLCVNPGTTVVSKTASTVTLSNPSSVSINTVAVFFPYGNGNGSTTFNVPDLRGVVIAGRNNMGGTPGVALDTLYYGTTPDALYAIGGSRLTTLTRGNLPNVSFTNSGITLTNNPITTLAGISFSVNYSLPPGGGSSSFVTSGTNQSSLAGTTTNVTVASQGSAASGGTDTPFSRIQPTATLNYVIKITPDTSSSIATGVYSIGGMSGVISCGTGILCTGNIISFNGNVIAGGSTGSVQYRNSDGSFGGSPNLIFTSPNNLSFGAIGTTAQFDILGSTSGRIRQQAQAVASTPTVTWGTSSGTPVVTAQAPLSLNTGTGDLTCPTCATSSLNGQALTRTNDANVTLTLGGAATTALLSPASITVGWTGTLAAGRLNSNVVQAVTNDTNVTGSIAAQTLTLGWTGQLAVGKGGTGLSSGTSGGVPYFNSTSTMASSALLGANQLMIGGGAGAAPSTITCATTTTVVHGGTPPTCSQVVSVDITTNTISNDRLVQVAARTVKGNPTGSTASVQDVAAATARSSSLLNIDQLTTHGDSDYTILNTDRSVFTSAVLTTVRTWTLPAANTVNAGQEITIWDAAGGIISPNNLTIARTGADTINGSTSAIISTQYGGLTLKSDGVSAYTYVPASSGGSGGSGTVTSITCNGGATTITTSGTCASREILSANRTYYVRSDGSDSNTCLVDSAGGACLTIAGAIAKLGNIDAATYDVTIQISVAGTYAGATIDAPLVGSAGSSLTIVGSTITPSNFTLSSQIGVSTNAAVNIQGLKFVTSGYAIQASNGAIVNINGAVDFGACASGHLRAVSGGKISVSSNYTISGGTANHLYSDAQGYILAGGLTVTLTGTPNFSSFFANTTTGYIQANSNTYSGAATGARYSASANGVIQTLGGGATYFPGNAAGSTATGGLYL